MKKLIALATMIAVAVAFAPGASAAEKGDGKKGKPAAQQCTGKIASISAECVEVEAKGGNQKFTINAGTKFGTKTEPKTCSDFKTGDRVTVRFKTEGDCKVALGIAAPAPRKPAAKK
jgi:hypothetical protein